MSELRFLSSNLQKCLEDSVDFSKHVAALFKGHKHIFFLGSPGLASLSVREGALKMKELTYLHCQALTLSGGVIANSGAMSYFKKDPSAPMIIVILEKGNPQEAIEALRIIKDKGLTAGRQAVVITDIKDKESIGFFSEFT